MAAKELRIRRIAWLLLLWTAPFALLLVWLVWWAGPRSASETVQQVISPSIDISPQPGDDMAATAPDPVDAIAGDPSPPDDAAPPPSPTSVGGPDDPFPVSAVYEPTVAPEPVLVLAAYEPPRAPSTWSEPPPRDTDATVYNALLAPQAPGNPALPGMPVLRAGKPTTLRFDMGPPRAGSVLSAESAMPNAKVLMANEDVPLDIVLTCDFCAPGLERLRHTVYRTGARRADEVAFTFTPSPKAAGGRGRLEIGIIDGHGGREYDRLVIKVAVVGGDASVSMPPAAIAPSVALGPASVQREGRAPPSLDAMPASDVTLHAQWEPDHRKLVLSVRPHGEEMRDLLPAALDENDQPRHFEVKVPKELIQQLAAEDFGVMFALNKDGWLAKRLRAQGMSDGLDTSASTTLQLTPDDREEVNRIIANAGYQLYRQLFGKGGKALLQLSEQLEKAALDRQGRPPLRLTVVVTEGALPWQYLYPKPIKKGEPIDGNDFWGMRYSLSVIREDTGALEGLSPPESEGPGRLVMARFENEQAGDNATLTELAELQRDMILGLPMEKASFSEFLEADGFMGELSTRRQQLTALVFYLHGDSSQTDRAPYLSFGNGDQISSVQLEQLWNSEALDAQQDVRYWPRGPLVFLNACETGPSRQMPHLALDTAMFQLGARGVVVTESPVWAHLGHEMAIRLIPRLARGQTVPEALTATRRELYAERGNALGLLYAYYGDPAATLVYP